MVFDRLCVRCFKKFSPHTRFTKLCDKCWQKSLRGTPHGLVGTFVIDHKQKELIHPTRHNIQKLKGGAEQWETQSKMKQRRSCQNKQRI